MHYLNADAADNSQPSPRHVALSTPRARLKALVASSWPSVKWKRKFDDIECMIQSHHDQLAQSIRASGRRDVGYYQREMSLLRRIDDPYTHMKLYWYARIYRWFGAETCSLWYARQRFIRRWSRIDKADMFRTKVQDTGGTLVMPCFYGQESYWTETLNDAEMCQLFLSTWCKMNGPLVELEDETQHHLATRLFRCLYNLEAGVLAHFPYHVIFHLACVCTVFKVVLHEYHNDLSMHRPSERLITVSPRELDPQTSHCKM